jgi:predicted AAA+ superfamily ATPase
MILRTLTSFLKRGLSDFPAMALLGPRQCGKTTLAKNLRGQYFDLELAQERLRLDLQWSEIENAKRLVIFDEAQAWPELFNRLRSAIDRDRKRCGRFLLLGSVSPSLTQQVSESLAGRMGLCELTPLLPQEVSNRRLDALWLYGGYPDGGILSSKHYPSWQSHYLNLLAQRDLPQWGLPSKPFVTERLFKMLALHHGQILNATQMGGSLGVSYHTIQNYLGFLRGAYLIRILEPYHANLKKRLLKSPKIYWRDSGLLHSLLGLENKADLFSQPWVGQSWEGWVIEQIHNMLTTRGVRFESSYFRTQDGLEADLVLKFNKTTIVVEIKLTTAPDVRDFDKLRRIGRLVHATHLCLISRTAKSQIGSNELSCHLWDFLEWIENRVLT